MAGFQQYIMAPAEALVSLPDGLSDVDGLGYSHFCQLKCEKAVVRMLQEFLVDKGVSTGERDKCGWSDRTRTGRCTWKRAITRRRRGCDRIQLEASEAVWMTSKFISCLHSLRQIPKP